MQNFEYFNLREAGDTAVVRILHSGVHTIEIKNVHTIMEGTKRRIVNCTGQGCPICASNNAPYERAYIHLWDYTDNKEKIWARTVKILEQFDQIAKSWGNLSNCVLQITRKTNEFPTYDVIRVNAQAYPVPNATVDEKVVGYMGLQVFSGEGYVTNVAVLPEYRRQGIAKMLIEKQMQNEMSFITLEVRESNLPAVRLYESCGFENVGIRPKFYSNPTENAIIMTKYFTE